MRYLYSIVVFVGGVLIQWCWPTYFSFFGLSPQILLVLTVAVAAHLGPIPGQTFAFFWGLTLDVFGAHLFGGNALALTLTAYGVGMVRRQMDVSNPVSQAMFTGIITFVYFLFLVFLGFIFKGEFFWMGWKAFCLDPILNALVAPICFFIVAKYLRSTARSGHDWA